MRIVKMLIEDYDLMSHARRAFVAWARAEAKAGRELAAPQRRALAQLDKDMRLDGAVFMTWESSPETDMGWIVALRWLDTHVDNDLVLASIPAAERQAYLDGRRGAIARVLAKLDGSITG